MRTFRPFLSTFAVAVLAAIHPCSARAQQAPVPAVNPSDRAAVLALYHDYYLSSEGVAPTWTGSVAAGQPGMPGYAYQLATLRRINYYRAMSGLPGNVALDPAASAKCQQAALMMAAEGNVSHQPPSSWRCYTPAAAEASANSALALDSRADAGPAAIDRYIADDGANNAFVGHRRWLLYPGTVRMGVGIVPLELGRHPGANATWVRGAGPALPPGVRPSVAWPPAGFVPAPLVYHRWSFAYPNADFSHATVRVTKDGVPLLAALEPLGRQTRPDGTGYSAGHNTMAWTLVGNVVGRVMDESYVVCVDNVVVAGVARRFSYPVTSIPVGTVEGRVLAPATVAEAVHASPVQTYALAGQRRDR